MKAIIIRKATMEDLSSIQNLNQQLFIYEVTTFKDESLDINWPYKESGIVYFKRQIERELLLVAEVSNQIVGYISWYNYIDLAYKDEKHVELDNIFVLEEYRKMGIGTKLFEALKTKCKEDNIDYIVASTNFKNTNAISFYEKNNFEKQIITLKQKIE